MSSFAGSSFGTASGLKKRELYGGAISTVLPDSFEDVSVFRQVPDHQEVFVDKHTDMSFIVELLGYESGVKDAQAATYFFTDLAESNEAAETLIDYEGMMNDPNFMPKLGSSFPKCSIRGRQSISKFRTRSDIPIDMVQIFMVVVRLPSVETDVLITLNAPYAQVSPLEVAEKGDRRGFLSSSTHNDNQAENAGAEIQKASTDAEPSPEQSSGASGEDDEEVSIPLKKADPAHAEYIMGAALAQFDINDWTLFG
jgi:hypothetical protein